MLLIVIECNRYRDKTWREKLAEAEALEKILKPKAKEQLKTHTKESYQNYDKAVHILPEVAHALNISHDTYHKAKTIAKEKPELLDKIDAGKRFVHSGGHPISFRAERRLGEILKGTGRNKGKLKQGQNFPWFPEGTTETPTLSDIGISKKLSSRAQRVAGIPEEIFEEYIEAIKRGV